MKYTILGFQQQKLIENKLNVEDAFILRTIKDMYASASMEFKMIDNKRYMWINYSYLLEQIPIVGSKRNLMRKIEKYGEETLLLRILEFTRNGKKGKFAYIKPTERLDSLEDFDLMTKSHKGYDKSDIRVMTKSHNKDTSIKDTSIKDNKHILSDTDKDKLNETFHNIDIEFYLDKIKAYEEEKGKKYKNYYTTIQNWARRDILKNGSYDKKVLKVKEKDLKRIEQFKKERGIV